MKISFDFDETLDRAELQDIAESFIKDHHDVWIVTSRFQKHANMIYNNNDLWAVAKYINIPKEKVIFTNLSPKYLYFKDMNFDLHLDNDKDEVREIIENTCTHAINVWEEGWQDLLNNFMKNKK